MSEPTKYVVPTDMLTGEWPGMRVYGDTTRVVTLADALAWVAELEQAHAAVLAENSELWKRLDATHEAQAAALEVAHERGMRTTGHYRVAYERGRADAGQAHAAALAEEQQRGYAVADTLLRQERRDTAPRTLTADENYKRGLTDARAAVDAVGRWRSFPDDTLLSRAAVLAAIDTLIHDGEATPLCKCGHDYDSHDTPGTVANPEHCLRTGCRCGQFVAIDGEATPQDEHTIDDWPGGFYCRTCTPLAEYGIPEMLWLTREAVTHGGRAGATGRGAFSGRKYLEAMDGEA